MDAHEKLSHKKLAQHIEKELHTNLYEHRESILKFVGYFVIYGILGVVLGGLLDYFVGKAQGTTPSKIVCGGWLVGLLAINAVVFYVLLLVKKGIKFDDWMMSTFVGFVFSLCFFTAQSRLASNMQCIFG